MLGNDDEGDDDRCFLTSDGIAQPNSPSVDASLVDLPPSYADQVLDNVLENVLRFLTSHHDRNVASLVCKSWFRIEAQTRLELFIGNCYAINPARAIGRFPCIKSLVLKGKPHFIDYDQVLDSMFEEGLRMVAATCKNLRELRVFPLDDINDSKCFISDVGLEAISEGCKKLQSMIYFCYTMTNAVVVIMSKNCQALVLVFRLYITGLPPDYLTGELMDDKFGAIVKNCKKLTRLSVSGLLSDKAFAHIGRYGKLVRTLTVDFAGNSNLGLRCVLEGCPKLQKLEIKCSGFGDTTLLSGIHHYYNMRFLWMSSCEVSVEGCEEVAKRLPHMVVKVIRGRLEDDNSADVENLYMYRSLVGQRNDAPPFVKLM